VAQQADMPRNVLFVFQPAEETTGGAKQIVDSGIFARHNVVRVFGMHLWPELPFGTVASCSGPMFAKSSEVNVEIEGVSTHIAKAKDGADALEAGVLFVAEAYRMIAGEVPQEQPKLLKFGMMHSGTVRNALSAHTSIRGSLRSFDPDVFLFMKKRLFEIAADVSEKTGAKVMLDLNEGYPPVLNDAALFDIAQRALNGQLLRLTEPAMTAEDFSFYQQAVPGLFMCLGTGGVYPLHSEKFDFDEEVFGAGIENAMKLLRAE
jgi:hippurate hydrolase